MSIANLVYPALAMISLLKENNKQQSQDKYDELKSRLDLIQDKINMSQNSANITETSANNVIPVNTQTSTTVIKNLLNNMIDVSKDLDEALRFAREDGVEHPESELRTKNAKKMSEELEDNILSIERIDLSPINVVNVNPDEKKVIDHVLPQIRRLRQQIVNNLDNVNGIEKSAAMANDIATQLKVATAVLNQKNSKTNDKSVYSKYAPDMTVDTGCIECGKAHIAMADITLRKAAKLAEEKGFTNPEVQSKLTLAQQELAALFDYDWTSEKIERTVGKEQKVLKQYSPEIMDVYKDITNLENEQQLYGIAKRMKNARDRFNSALEG